MKTSRTVSFSVAALITLLQLGALAAAFSIAPAQTSVVYEQDQAAQSHSSLAPILVVASQTD